MLLWRGRGWREHEKFAGRRFPEYVLDDEREEGEYYN